MFLALGNSSLLTKFQLDIFILKDLATDQTSLQSLKQNSNWSAHSGRNFSSKTRAKSLLLDSYYTIESDQKKIQTSTFNDNESTSFQSLLQSLKQNVQRSAHSGRMTVRF